MQLATKTLSTLSFLRSLNLLKFSHNFDKSSTFTSKALLFLTTYKLKY
nr:MAG TPA: hypothetical protein [Crassvirales sp.]